MGRQVRLNSVTMSAQQAVFNLEVQFDHVYHVGRTGILVHNGTPCPPNVPAHVGNLDEPIAQARKLNTTVEQTVESIDDMKQTLKGVITRTQSEAEELAKQVAQQKGITDATISAVERHGNGLPHVHIEELRDIHIWFQN